MKAPLIVLRDRKASTKDFRNASKEIARILAQETNRRVRKVNAKKVVLVPILRAGLALLPEFIEKFPDASVGFIGLKRNEKTLKPKAYYQNIPKISKGDQVVVLDPMLATGGSAVAGITTLIAAGAHEENIIFVGVISAPEGIAKLQKNFPKVGLVIAVHDDKLDKTGYIIPGLGDFGDRYFKTSL